MKGERKLKSIAFVALAFLGSITGFCFWGFKRIEDGKDFWLPDAVVNPILWISFLFFCLAVVFYVSLVVKAFWEGLTSSDGKTLNGE